MFYHECEVAVISLLQLCHYRCLHFKSMQLKDVMEQKKVPVITQRDGSRENEQRVSKMFCIPKCLDQVSDLFVLDCYVCMWTLAVQCTYRWELVESNGVHLSDYLYCWGVTDDWGLIRLQSFIRCGSSLQTAADWLTAELVWPAPSRPI